MICHRFVKKDLFFVDSLVPWDQTTSLRVPMKLKLVERAFVDDASVFTEIYRLGSCFVGVPSITSRLSGPLARQGD